MNARLIARCTGPRPFDGACGFLRRFGWCGHFVMACVGSVFGALMYLTEKYGRVFPSLEGLAHLAMCCKQSVVTAIADLERLGFVTRIRRIRQIKTALGFITRQITNAYRVHEPTRGLGLLANALFATESNSWTPSDG